ncbi:hypothetical protein AAHU66_03705 [Klebsiella pneumoniae]|uniref:Uncharacterized protein n=4 Tax=Enterobacteriaceae TaxID=543 RepID=A0ABZ2DYM9_RAOOR|nr:MULTISPECIES: hypothetical protein [Enterobacteriaceae]ELO7118826.1 hypothetical protein [Escherichia coli]HAT2206893.1 hypothetical protein [Kluyvera intermedia]HAT2278800.1 hypothetical protein [Raoultella ornithinolytica]AKL15184.1 hypothetical protein AB182_29650 [Phytobacter ursingii]MBG1741944.1 hypothetical protein [Klebsiella pneumoniae]
MEKNNIDICAEEIKDYYFICLKENNGRIFANSATYRVKIWEQVEQKAFRKSFFNFFKTQSQHRKTKHIKSDSFVMAIRDLKNKFYYPTFTINKKEYETRGDEYLNEVKECFINIINEKIKERKNQ